MHQRNHFVCLYLKTCWVRFLLFPSPIPFKLQNFVISGPVQFQQVLQKIIGCRTFVLHIEFFFSKSLYFISIQTESNFRSLISMELVRPEKRVIRLWFRPKYNVYAGRGSIMVVLLLFVRLFLYCSVYLFKCPVVLIQNINFIAHQGQVSYCHHLASVVRHKLFKKSSPLKLLHQLKPNLV